jgi:hypothetical protein
MSSVLDLVAVWEASKADLDAAKIRESAARDAVIAAAFAPLNEGTNTKELDDGRKLKAVQEFEYALEKDEEKVSQALDKIRATGNEGTFLADRLVTYSPKLSVGEYRKLEKVYAKIINKVVTRKPKKPTLKIDEPKAA